MNALQSLNYNFSSQLNNLTETEKLWTLKEYLLNSLLNFHSIEWKRFLYGEIE